MIALYYSLMKLSYSLYRYYLFLCYFVLPARSIPYALVSPMFSHALSRIFDSSYRMVSIHGFTFGSRYLFSTGGAIVTTRTPYLICTNLPHQSMPHAPSPSPISQSLTRDLLRVNAINLSHLPECSRRLSRRRFGAD
jgi:hypothetical protein